MREIFSNFFISDKLPTRRMKEQNNSELLIVYCTAMDKTELAKETIDKNVKIYCNSKDEYLLNNCFYFLNKNKDICIVYDLSNISIFNEFMYEFVNRNCGETTKKDFIDICIYNDIPFML